MNNPRLCVGFGSAALNFLLRTHDRPFHLATTGARNEFDPSPHTSFLVIALPLDSKNPWNARWVQVRPCKCQVPVPGATCALPNTQTLVASTTRQPVTMPGVNFFTSLQRPFTSRRAAAALADPPPEEVPANAQTLRRDDAAAQPIPVLPMARGKVALDQARPFQCRPTGKLFSGLPLTLPVPSAQMLCRDGATRPDRNADFVLATTRHGVAMLGATTVPALAAFAMATGATAMPSTASVVAEPEIAIRPDLLLGPANPLMTQPPQSVTKA